MPAPSRPRVYEGICCIRGKRRARNCIDLDNIILKEKDGEAMNGKIRKTFLGGRNVKREIRSGSILLTLECYLCKV